MKIRRTRDLWKFSHTPRLGTVDFNEQSFASKISDNYQMVSRKAVRFNDDRIPFNVETWTFSFSVDKVLKCHLIESTFVKLESDRVWLAAWDFLGDLRRSEVSTPTIVFKIGSTPTAQTKQK